MLQGDQEGQRVALADVAQRAASGEFDGPAALEAAVHGAARQIAAALGAQAAAVPAGLAGCVHPSKKEATTYSACSSIASALARGFVLAQDDADPS